MSNKRFDKIDAKLDKIEDFLSNYRVKAEKRMTKIEMIQKGFMAVGGTVLATFYSVVAYLMTGGD